MPGTTEGPVTRRVIVEAPRDRVTPWLMWSAAFLSLMVVAVIIYGIMSGAFNQKAPKTAEEFTLATTAQAIAKDPKNGLPYATRAEALYKLGKVDDAFTALEQGEKAVGKDLPDILFVLRTRAMLLNQEERYAEAEKVCAGAMNLSDDYLAKQIEKLTAKGIVAAGGNLDTKASVDIALQYGQALDAQKKWKRAENLYSWALKWEPAAADILALRGWTYVGMGAESSATADFKEALKYLPNDPSALAGLEKAKAMSKASGSKPESTSDTESE